MTDALWQPLRDELNRWSDAGLKARLWLRDDDAVEPTPALNRMEGLSLDYFVPITLAVIPARAEEALAKEIDSGTTPFFHIAVHGWSHTNYAPPGEKKQELGPHRPRWKVMLELWRSRKKLEKLFNGGILPMLVPPWNRIDPSIVPGLKRIGYEVLSTFGRKNHHGLININTHVDIIDWHGSRGCIEHSILISQLVEELTASRLSTRYPVGILTHHLVHDESAFKFLEALFEASWHAACEWIDPREIMP